MPQVSALALFFRELEKLPAEAHSYGDKLKERGQRLVYRSSYHRGQRTRMSSSDVDHDSNCVSTMTVYERIALHGRWRCDRRIDRVRIVAYLSGILGFVNEQPFVADTIYR